MNQSWFGLKLLIHIFIGVYLLVLVGDRYLMIWSDRSFISYDVNLISLQKKAIASGESAIAIL